MKNFKRLTSTAVNRRVNQSNDAGVKHKLKNVVGICSAGPQTSGKSGKSHHVISPFEENDNEWDCRAGCSFESSNGSYNLQNGRNTVFFSHCN